MKYSESKVLKNMKDNIIKNFIRRRNIMKRWNKIDGFLVNKEKNENNTKQQKMGYEQSTTVLKESRRKLFDIILKCEDLVE